MGEPVDLDTIAGETEPRSITMGGELFYLLPEVPIAAFEAMRDERLVDAFVLLLVDPATDEARLRATRPTMRHLVVVLGEVYGITPGESSASTLHSATTGQRSRPTSNGSTGSTSVPVASVPSL